MTIDTRDKKVGKYSGVDVVSWEMGLIPISYGPRSKSPTRSVILCRKVDCDVS